jgi:hypothetical protein
VKGSAPLDLALLFLPPLSLALLVLAHVAIVVALVRRTPRWRAAVALVVPPLAGVWGREAKLTGWGRLWLGACIAYAVTLGIALAS